jgi:S1-C subfamily serine protease
MLTLIAAVLSAVISITTLKAPPPTVESVVERVMPSMAPIAVKPDSGVCSSFSVAKNEFLTAAHCVTPVMRIGGKEISGISMDRHVDLALVRVPDLDLPPLKLAKVVTLGEKLVSFGWGYGSMKIGVNSVSEMVDGEVVAWGAYVPGMSGGPVVNMRGELVSVVQAAHKAARTRPWVQAPLGVGPDPGVIETFLVWALESSSSQPERAVPIER